MLSLWKHIFALLTTGILHSQFLFSARVTFLEYLVVDTELEDSESCIDGLPAGQ